MTMNSGVAILVSLATTLISFYEFFRITITNGFIVLTVDCFFLMQTDLVFFLIVHKFVLKLSFIDVNLVPLKKL